MTRPLSRKRKIEDNPNWSEDFDDFLKPTTTYESPRIIHSEIRMSKPNTNKHLATQPIKSHSNYEIKKKAFLSSQKLRTATFKNFQSQLEKTETLIRKARTPSCIQKQKNFVRVPVKQVDDHLIERIISRRRQEYAATSNNLPKGYVVDLKMYHSLPPDRTFDQRETPRVFYWG